jgi:hypothetical protein
MAWVIIDLKDGGKPIDFVVSDQEEQRLHAFLAECHQAKRDAARYRFLREENAKAADESAWFVGLDDDAGGVWVGCDLDTVIDAHLKYGEG